jgi:excisionase family DNA binding protein
MSADENAKPKPKRKRTVPAPTAPSRLLSAADAARYLGIPYTSLRDVALRGELPIVQLGRRWFFTRTSLDELIASHTERRRA